MALSDFFGGSNVDFGKAQNIYEQSSQQILDEIKRAESQGRTDIADSLKRSLALNQPFISAGNTAMSSYLNSLGIGPQGPAGQGSLRQQFQQDPGYQYALQQAQNAIQRRAGATGQSMSGAEMRELTAQAQGQANQGWENWLGNFQNRLSDIAGFGQRSSMQQAGLETQGGANLANLGRSYAGLSTQEMEAMAKARAEAEMAQQVQNAQNRGNWLSTIGSMAGGAASGFAMGGPWGAIAGAGGSLLGGNKQNDYSNAGNWLSRYGSQNNYGYQPMNYPRTAYDMYNNYLSR